MARPLFNFLFFIFVIGCVSTFGQTSAFNYQGKLTDGASAANGTYEMQFKLYDSLSGTTQIGSTVTNSSVTVTNGIFNVLLDFGASSFPGDARYLEIAVKKTSESSYTTLSPRQQITSVPYSVQTLNATNFSGNLSGDVSGTQNATIVNSVGGQSSTNVANAVTDVTNATSNNTASTIVKRDASGNFSAGTGTFSALTVTNNASITSTLSSFNGLNGFLAGGTENSGTIPTTGAGVRMMWYPNKFAFRAGKVDGTQWDDSNIGSGSISFGNNNISSGNNSFTAGNSNTASGLNSFAFGDSSTASAEKSLTFNGFASGVGAMAIGVGSRATNDDALALGPSSTAGGLASIAIGPSIANGAFAVAIGLQNKAYGLFSMALGKNASTCSTYDCNQAGNVAYQGTIVIGDGCAGFSTDAVTASANNQINIRGCGGFRFFTNQGLTSGVQLASGAGSWSSISDRNMKENFSSVNPRDVLKKLVMMPVSTWNYKSQDKSIRHMGVMAQDFYSTFGIGESDKMIATIDPDGVAFAAIQGLNEELKDRDKKIEDQQKQLNDLQEQVKQQQALLEALKKMLCADKSDAAVCKQ